VETRGNFHFDSYNVQKLSNLCYKMIFDLK